MELDEVKIKTLGDYKPESIDANIVKLVKALNYINIETRFSCSGHTKDAKSINIYTGEEVKSRNILGPLNNTRKEAYGTGVNGTWFYPTVTFQNTVNKNMEHFKKLLEEYNRNSDIKWEIIRLRSDREIYVLKPEGIYDISRHLRIKLPNEKELIAMWENGERLAKFIFDKTKERDING